MIDWQALIGPEFSGRLCLALLHSIWQVTLLVLLAWIADRLLRNNSVERSYSLHVAALLAAFAAMPITFMLVDSTGDSRGSVDDSAIASTLILDDLEARHYDEQTASVIAMPVEYDAPSPDRMNAGQQTFDQAVAVLEEPRPRIANADRVASIVAVLPSDPQPQWYRYAPWLAAIYGAGVALMLIRLIVAIINAHRLGAQASPITDGPLMEILNRLSERWSLTVVPKLAQVEATVIPQVVGLFRSTILLPASAISGLSPSELEMILAHELAHVRRHDMWVNLVQRLAEAVLFFNPALWYLSRRISTLREYCCDELACEVVTDQANQSEPRLRYAQALLRVVELKQDTARTEKVAALAASGRCPSELRHRVARLFGEPLREPLRVSRSTMLVLAATTGMLIAGSAVWSSTNQASDSPLANHDTIGGVVEEDIAEPDVILEGDFASQAGKIYTEILRSHPLPFIDKQRREEMVVEFTQVFNKLFESKRIDIDKVPEKRRVAILTSMRDSGAFHLDLLQLDLSRPQVVNRIYLGLPNRIKTLQWQVCMALDQGELSETEAVRLEKQRQWMRNVIKKLPEDDHNKHTEVLEILNKWFADPLMTPLDSPMTEEQFIAFEKATADHIENARVGHTSTFGIDGEHEPKPYNPMSGLPGDFLRDGMTVKLGITNHYGPDTVGFDGDGIKFGGASGSMRDMRFSLGFSSNRDLLGRRLSLSDFKKSYDYDVIDAKTGSGVETLWSIREKHDREAVIRSLEARDIGDIAYEDNGFFSIRGAKLLRLDVDTWPAADAIDDFTLRMLLETKGVSRIGIEDVYRSHLAWEKNRSETVFHGAFVGVLTSEGNLAVTHTDYFGGRNPMMLTRPRPLAKNEGSTKTRADTEVNKDADSDKESATMNTLITESNKRKKFGYVACVGKLKFGSIKESEIDSVIGVKCEATCEVISSLKGLREEAGKQINIVYRRGGKSWPIERDPVHAGGTYLVELVKGDAETYKMFGAMCGLDKVIEPKYRKITKNAFLNEMIAMADSGQPAMVNSAVKQIGILRDLRGSEQVNAAAKSENDLTAHTAIIAQYRMGIAPDMKRAMELFDAEMASSWYRASATPLTNAEGDTIFRKHDGTVTALRGVPGFDYATLIREGIKKDWVRNNEGLLFQIVLQVQRKECVPELIKLLDHQEKKVRSWSVACLARTVGNKAGPRSEDYQLNEQTYLNKWLDWWRNEGEAYMAAPVGPRLTYEVSLQEMNEKLQKGAEDSATDTTEPKSNSKLTVTVTGADDGEQNLNAYLTLWRVIESDEKEPVNTVNGLQGFGYYDPVIWEDEENNARWIRAGSAHPNDGRHSINGVESYDFSSLRPGRYRVTAVSYRPGVTIPDPTPYGVSEPITLDGSTAVTLDVKMARGDADLKVKVVDAKTRKPIPGLALRLRTASGMPIVHGHGNGNFFEATSDQGKVRFAQLPSGVFTVEVLGKQARVNQFVDYLPQTERLRINVKPGQQDIEIAVVPQHLEQAEIDKRFPFSVSGRVTDADKKPLADVEVRTATGIGTLLGGGQTKTDAEGRYKLYFGAGSYLVNKDSTPDIGIQAAHFFCDKPGWKLDAPDGYVAYLMSDGTPEEFAKLLEQKGGEYWGKSDADEVIFAGQPKELNFVLTKENKPTALTDSLVVKVIDNRGQPLPLCKIVLDGRGRAPKGQGGPRWWSKKTDKEGIATFANFSDLVATGGRYKVWVNGGGTTSDGYSLSPSQMTVTDGNLHREDPLVMFAKDEANNNQTLTFTLHPACPLNFRVQEKETEKPIDFASVVFRDDRVKEWTWLTFFHAEGHNDMTTIIEAMSDADYMAIRYGYYPQPFKLDRPLKPEPPKQEAKPPGQLENLQTVSLAPAPLIQLTVLQPDGRVAQDAKIEYIAPTARRIGSYKSEPPTNDLGESQFGYPALGDLVRYCITHASGSAEIAVKDLPKPVWQRSKAPDEAKLTDGKGLGSDSSHCATEHREAKRWRVRSRL